LRGRNQLPSSQVQRPGGNPRHSQEKIFLVLLDILQRIRLEATRFGIEPEITAKVARLNCRIYEVEVHLRRREEDLLEGRFSGPLVHF
jgi:hypothetical protein